MPIKDGIQTTLELSKFNENSKIIFTSANKWLKDKALDAGAAAFLEKPFLLQDLANTINVLLQECNIVNLKKNQKIPD
jgi:DNA-binding response OmpR family regulator